MEVTEKTGLETGKSYINRYAMRYKLVGLYIFLLAGGLWHILGVFESLMRTLAAPVMIGLSIWMVWEYAQSLNNQEAAHAERKLQVKRFYIWAASIFTAGFAVEWIGVKSGYLFGDYAYGSTLQPQLSNVPLAIGFAWLGTLMASTAVIFRLLPGLSQQRPLWAALFPAVLMVLFDLFMEPVAVKLGYWHWAGDTIPLYNYVCWFVISYIFTLAALQLKIFSSRFPAVVFHAYFAQLGYFLLVFFEGMIT